MFAQQNTHYECKNSRDDHFANRVCGEILECTTISDNDIDHELNEQDILLHMSSIEQISSIRKLQQQDMTIDSLHHMEISGQFNLPYHTLRNDRNCANDVVVEVNPNDLSMEDE
jgi:hypothetical protein